MRNGLVKCRDYIFNFLEDPLIPSDINASERGIRKLKVKLKNSGAFRSDLGADAFFDIHSIVETAKNNIRRLMPSVHYFKARKVLLWKSLLYNTLILCCPIDLSV